MFKTSHIYYYHSKVDSIGTVLCSCVRICLYLRYSNAYSDC